MACQLHLFRSSCTRLFYPRQWWSCITFGGRTVVYTAWLLRLRYPFIKCIFLEKKCVFIPTLSKFAVWLLLELLLLVDCTRLKINFILSYLILSYLFSHVSFSSSNGRLASNSPLPERMVTVHTTHHNHWGIRRQAPSKQWLFIHRQWILELTFRFTFEPVCTKLIKRYPFWIALFETKICYSVFLVFRYIWRSEI